MGTGFPLSRVCPHHLPVGGGQQPAWLLRVYLGLFGALPRGTCGLMGTMLLRGVFGQSDSVALKKNCVLCQERWKSCGLIWSGNFCAWRRSGGSEQASPLGGQSLNAARKGRPVCELLCRFSGVWLPAFLAAVFPFSSAAPLSSPFHPLVPPAEVRRSCREPHPGPVCGAECRERQGCAGSPTAPGPLCRRWSFLHRSFAESCCLLVHFLLELLFLNRESVLDSVMCFF